MLDEIKKDEPSEPDNKGLENVSGGMEHEWGPGRRLGSGDGSGYAFPYSPTPTPTPTPPTLPQNPEEQPTNGGAVRPRNINVLGTPYEDRAIPKKRRKRE